MEEWHYFLFTFSARAGRGSGERLRRVRITSSAQSEAVGNMDVIPNGSLTC